MKRIALAVALASLCSWSPSARAWDTTNLETSEGVTLEYVLVKPENFDAGRPSPVLLAFTGGKQDSAALLGGLRKYWGEEAAHRGWVVVTPLAPEGQTFYTGAESLIPELLDEVSAQVPVEGGRFHLAGLSSGGLSAFRVAIDSPERFASLVVFPGGPTSAADVSRLDRLTGIAVRMFAGTEDEEYLRLMDGTARQLDRLGVDVQALSLKGEGTPPRSVDSAVLFEVLERVREDLAEDPGAAATASFESPDMLLDGLQSAAARGNGKRFFACFAADSVAYWLDPDSRWTREELAERLQPRFGTGERLRFAATERHLTPLPGGGVAFDEKLVSLELGRCRSQGVLLNRDEGWRIFRYGLDCEAQTVLPSMGP